MIETIFNENQFGKYAQVRMDYESMWMLDFSIDVDHDDDGNDIYLPTASIVHLTSNTTVWSLDDITALYMVGHDGGTYEEAIERIKEIIFDFCADCERAVEYWNEKMNEECERLLRHNYDDEYVEECLENMVTGYVNDTDVTHMDAFAKVLMEDAKREYWDRKVARDFEEMGI
jgi:hypothetical protein